MKRLYLGLISGTSADGIDAALVEFDSAPRLLAAAAFPYQASLRHRLLALSSSAARPSLSELARLDVQVGEAFADAALALCAQHGISASSLVAIGSHGQTLQHGSGDPPHWTLQIGDPNRIVERCAVTTVADFRRRDIAAGGQGAPLLPAFHQICLRDRCDAVLNVGGIANLTLLERDDSPLIGFDTGPANALMDAWIERHHGVDHDRGGRWAAEAEPDAELLTQLLAHPYFALPAPKSTGRETFSIEWLDSQPGVSDLLPVVVQSTLCQLTVDTIAGALHALRPDCKALRVCGGGVHNEELMARLSKALPGVDVRSTAADGVDPDWMEAMAFAWLARETLAGRPGNAASVTGAKGPRILGAIYQV